MLVNQFVNTFYDKRAIRFSANTVGRDFVVGDIHGCFSDLESLLRQVHFDKSADRLFAVGDLVDRGPDSRLVINYLSQSWFHSVRGNHEQTLLDAYLNVKPSISAMAQIGFSIRRNGLGWWLDVAAMDRVAIIDAFAYLPAVIEIESNSGLVGIVHADMPKRMDWQSFVSQVNQDCEETLQTALQGRQRFCNGTREVVRGIEHVFVGHNTVSEVMRLGNVFHIDNGACLRHLGIKNSGAMTLYRLDGSAAASLATESAQTADLLGG